MSALLIAEPLLLADPTLARRIGLQEAVVLQQVHFLARDSDDGAIAIADLDLPFLSDAAIRQTFKSLRQQKLIVATGNVAGRRRYRVDHDVVDLLPPDVS